MPVCFECQRALGSPHGSGDFIPRLGGPCSCRRMCMCTWLFGSRVNTRAPSRARSDDCKHTVLGAAGPESKQTSHRLLGTGQWGRRTFPASSPASADWRRTCSGLEQTRLPPKASAPCMFSASPSTGLQSRTHRCPLPSQCRGRERALTECHLFKPVVSWCLWAGRRARQDLARASPVTASGPTLASRPRGASRLCRE